MAVTDTLLMTTMAHEALHLLAGLRDLGSPNQDNIMYYTADGILDDHLLRFRQVDWQYGTNCGAGSVNGTNYQWDLIHGINHQ